MVVRWYHLNVISFALHTFMAVMGCKMVYFLHLLRLLASILVLFSKPFLLKGSQTGSTKTGNAKSHQKKGDLGRLPNFCTFGLLPQWMRFLSLKRFWRYTPKTFFFTLWAKLRSLKNIFFFFMSLFSNLQISVVLTIFLHMVSLLIKYDMMIFFSGFYQVSGFFQVFFKSSESSELFFS